MTTIVRFAPSPTGRLHLGNARAAVLNALYARQTGGTFLLRLDDTDRERSTAAFADGILDDMKWLGLADHFHARQSDRFARYAEAAERLKGQGLLYPAYETADELEKKRLRQRARGLPPVYDRAALALTPDDRAKLEAEGRAPHWRFKLTHHHVGWRDLVRGDVSIDTATLSDPVLIREDGQFLYTLPSVVDDIDFAITHVIRGEDHVVNTAVQIDLMKALGAVHPPAFAHYPMIVGPDGEKLSKRLGSLSLLDLRERGVEPMAVNSLLAKIGTSDPVEVRATLDQLAAEFSFGKISHAPARLDPADLDRLSAKLLHMRPYAEVESKLAELGVGGGEAFWLVIRENLARIEDAAEWWRIVSAPIDAHPVNDVTAKAVEVLPERDVPEDSWQLWIKAVGIASGRKGKELFQPLRLALTGKEHGPEMKKLLPFIGRDRALARLRGEKA